VSQPTLTWSTGALVSTGSAPSTLAAVEALRAGGNAFDAAAAASAALMVTLPMACGLAGDVAAVGFRADTGEPFAFLGLGAAPAAVSRAAFAQRGLDRIPLTGILSVTAPGALDAHVAFADRLGALPASRPLEVAAALAEDGVAVTPQLHRWIANNVGVLADDPRLLEAYAPGGEPPSTGATLRQPELGATMRALAGRAPGDIDPELARRIAEESRRRGGLLGEGDVLAARARFVDPVTVRVGDVELLTTPLPTQGYLLLQNVAMLERFRARHGRGDPDAEIHVLSEIVAQTFAQRLERAWDADDPDAELAALLDDANLEALLARVDPDRRSPLPFRGHYCTGDTTHFVVVDADGNAVSWIQSLGLGFGSGVGVPGTGVILGNRLGRSCTLDPRHRNAARPRRRPVNTIHAYVALRDGRPELVGGTPGGDGQPQWNAQVLARALLDGAGPEAAEAPRWTYLPGSDLCEAGQADRLEVDRDLDPGICAALARRGHRVVARRDVGGCVRLARLDGGTVCAADDGRQEGLTAAVEAEPLERTMQRTTEEVA
jgi:gamma-glutamyltranspeptidase/glutathione hydrolase